MHCSARAGHLPFSKRRLRTCGHLKFYGGCFLEAFVCNEMFCVLWEQGHRNDKANCVLAKYNGVYGPSND